ncbi:hypothetical protein DDB_G0285619 [Dictyostelium discoideum AX4]|uniref:Uncharacterized protein n=1 Tax=Dictyostelium discoideum TaxID=44689 RepID=Q54MX6_DICDI|nr:hypothetical protein DDB_G0285619 [Dictyostelium discoideum AX4]EAL64647.1 hypothetical protein DDB_G0285619 [Dictyostelium discoideum AX4]|eukprot:XP_638167.1 hypothetical protein DDB_G0285619 [Dictyostelium discoideum AX4]
MTITNYPFVTGSNLTSPCDIPRVALLAYTNQSLALNAAGGTIESASDLFSITLCKYYLNSVVSLSPTNVFGGVAHYSSLTTLMNNLDSAADTILNALYASINTCGTFTDLTATKFDTLSTAFSGYRTTILSLQTSSNTLKTAITTTRDSLTLTTDIYNTVKTCYTNVITALEGLSARLGQVASLLNTHNANFPTFKDNVTSYTDPEGPGDQSNYMSSMNYSMVTYLISSNTIFSKLYFYKRLRGVIF